MAIKVVITRRVPAEKTPLLKPLLVQLRSLAMHQQGYISGETLVNMSDPEEYLVISSWLAPEHWERWLADARRAAVQDQIDRILGCETRYRVYCHC